MYKIQQITRENFCETSLDGYIRTQSVTEVYRKINGLYKLVHHPFTDDWSPQRKREKALEILGEEFITYGAFDGDRVIGFVMLNKTPKGDRVILHSFQVHREYRHQGIGRSLFATAVQAGKQLGARRLYISACSSKETVAFYYAMGCKLTKDVIPEMVEDEPYDLQMEYKIDD